MNILTSIKYINNILFPPLCAHCQKEGRYICIDCMKSIVTYPECCFYCKKTSTNFLVCRDCKETSYFESIIINFSYHGAIKSSIREIKYHSYYTLIKSLINKCLYTKNLEQFSPSNTIITYVPMHLRKQYWIKGYNHATLLAKELSKQTGIPLVSLFHKSKRTRSQTKFTRQQRKINVHKSFTLSKTIPKHVKYILIVDDVITTGSTLTALAKLIKKPYPSIEIHGYCIARH